MTRPAWASGVTSAVDKLTREWAEDIQRRNMAMGPNESPFVNVVRYLNDLRRDVGLVPFDREEDVLTSDYYSRMAGTRR